MSDAQFHNHVNALVDAGMAWDAAVEQVAAEESHTDTRSWTGLVV